MQAQMDYIFFVYGFAFILLAAVCLMLHPHLPRLPWRLLALFGLLHGLNEWAEMLVISTGGTVANRLFIFILMASSFFFLFEFGRRGWIALQGKGPGWWIYIPLACGAGFGALWGGEGCAAATRYALAFPGGLWSANILFSVAKKEKAPGGGMLIASGAMALYAVAAGGIVSPADFFPANMINHPGFLTLTGVPIQLVRTILALLIVMGLWVSYSRGVREAGGMLEGSSLPPSLTGWPLAVGIIVLLLGWGATAYIGRLETQENKIRVIQQVQMGAAAVVTKRLRNLVEAPESRTLPDYQWLRERLRMIRAHDPNFLRLCVLLPRANAVVAVADSEANPKTDETYSPVSSELKKLFTHNESLLIGPYTDERGAVISVFASIHDPETGAIFGVFGMDVDARDWQKGVAQTRLISILSTLLIATLLIAFLILRQRAWQATELMNAKERRLAEAQRIAHLGGWDWDPLGKRFLCSDEMFRAMGVSEKTFVPSPETYLQLVYPADRMKVKKAMRQLLRGADLPSLEFRIVHPNGDVRVMLAQAKTWCDATGKPVRAAGNILDITERKKTEAELLRYRESLEQQVEERTAELTAANDALRLTQFAVDNSADAVFWIRPDATLFYVNDAACGMLGYTRVELLQMAAYDINLDKPRDAWPAYWQEVSSKNKIKYEAPFQAKDGHIVMVEVSANYIEAGDTSFNCAFARDITDRKRAEQTAQLLAAIVEFSDDAIYTKDTASVITSWNDSAERLYQYSREEAIGRHIGLIVPVDRMEELHRITEMHEQGGRITHFQTVRRRKDGELLDISLSVSPLRDANGFIIGFSAIARDITERIRMEEALRVKTEELDRFFNVVLDLLCIVDTDGRFLRINHAWENTLGFTNDELLSLTFPDLVHPDDQDRVLNAVSQLGPQQNILNFVNRCRCKDGSYRWLEWHATFAGDLFYAAARDITERRQTELELQKLALVVKNASELISLSDLDGRMIFINDAGARMVGVDPTAVRQHMIYDVLTESSQRIARTIAIQALTEHGHWEGNLQCRSLLTNQLTDVYTVAFQVRDPATGEPIYLANVSLDITEHKRAEAEREELIRGLQEALTEVKVLSGLLPICANCKKIRDDSGYWTQIEQYFHEHSGTRFSHGICPDCLRSFYPEFADEMLEKEDPASNEKG